VFEIAMDLPARNESEAVGFFMFGTDLRKHLREAHADRYGKAQLLFYRALDLLCYHTIGAVKGPAQAGEVHKCLVNGIFFNVRRKAPEYPEHAHGEEAVGLIVGWKDHGIRADLFDIREPYPPLDTPRLCLIACSCHNAPLFSGYDRPSPEFRVYCLLAGRKEGVCVNMQDGLRPGTDG